MKNKQNRSTELPYPENLIKVIGVLNLCENGQQISLSEDQIEGLNYVLNRFFEVERAIIRCRYEQHLSYEEIAQQLNRPKERIITIHRNLIQRLRRPSWNIYFREGYNAVQEARRQEDEQRNLEIEAEIRQIEEQTGLSLSGLQIADLNLPVRIVNALKYAGIYTLEDLIRWLIKDPKKAKRINGLGDKSWGEISEGLDSYGIHIV